jgi:hypothetical protein
MSQTIFFSWQSDKPSDACRSFIEWALAEAIELLHADATVEPAIRDTDPVGDSRQHSKR